MTAKSFWFQRFLFFFIPHCQLINNHVFWANFSTRWFHEIINFVLFFFSHCTEQSELRPTCAAALKNWALWWELTTDWDDTTAGADFIKTTDRTLGRTQINKIRLLKMLQTLRFSYLAFCSRSYALKLTFWETHKIWKNLPHGFDKSADLLSKRKIFFKVCVLLKKSELYDDLRARERDREEEWTRNSAPKRLSINPRL